ncbi:hypothetical protein Leryth_006012 [Lithospermum erythrorhizon]|nr:hypothetical protein Leryth_006012 [Lithospermum erythrorhizon]
MALFQSKIDTHKQENHMRLSNIDQKQRQLKTSLKPTCCKSLNSHLPQLQNKKRRLLVSNYLSDQASKQDRQLVINCDHHSNDVPMINLELMENLDTCVGFWENFFQDIAGNLLMEDDYEFGSLTQQSPLIGRIDVNSCPDNADSDEPKDMIDNGTTQTNDVFWQQFFTDTPEVESERKEHDFRSRLVNPNVSCWSVDSLAKQMGHLTPAEKT